jgi:ATP-dependent helicase HrpA
MIRPVLPILERRAEIEEVIRAHGVVVVCGETGSGKTTQLPRICYEMGLAGKGMIGHTQPRRLAARAVAARIAEEMGERLGGLVGVKVRFQDQTTRETRIKLMTDGMLLAELAGDRELREYSTIIIDEAHERSLNVDFLLGYLKELRARRPEMKVIITSATIDPKRFSDYFGGAAAAPVIEVSGRMFPVEVRYRPTRDEQEVDAESIADAVAELTRASMPIGDVLVFLPGEREIRVAAEALRRRDADAEVLPLFARLTSAEQDRIFHPSGGRRVILATNIAETSLTVPGIRFVVDTGLARQSRYDPERKVQRLPIEPVSRASANQRSGRCGRVAEGVCVRLYSEASYASRPAFTEPEIRRTNLAGVVLQMKVLDLGSVERFGFLDAPEASAIADAYETLFELGAIDAPRGEGRLTEVGRAMARLPLDPRVARMLIAAHAEGVESEIAILAGALSIQDPRERPLGRQEDADRAQLVFRDETSDFLTLLNLWDQYSHAVREMGGGDVRAWCRERFVNAARMREWWEVVRQLRDVVEEMEVPRGGAPAAPTSSPLRGDTCSPGGRGGDRIHRALLTGLISNVACREGDAGSFLYRGIRGNSVSIFPGSALFKKAPRWIMAAEIVQTTKLYARTVAKIELDWIEELAGHVLQRSVSDKHLDAETGKPSAWERVTMSGVVVVPRRRTDLAPIDPEGARGVFIREGLAECRWKTELAFMAHNRCVLERARQAEAKIRRRGLVRPSDEIAAWFAERVPASVNDPLSLERWLSGAERADPSVLRLPLAFALQPAALAALDEAQFPSRMMFGESEGELHYVLAPGKDEDGVTLTTDVAGLAELDVERIAWMVPGRLAEVLQGLVKTLPKGARAALEAKATGERVGVECAAVMEFGRGSIVGAFVEAIEVLYAVKVEAGQFAPKSLPPHLVMRVRVVDEHGKELAASRDTKELLERFEGRIRKARAARARSVFERRGVKSWDFGALPQSVQVERGDGTATMFPALVDEGESVRLTLIDSEQEALIATDHGMRRLYALACAGEVEHRITAMGEWDDMARQYQALGTTAQLKDQLVCVVAARAFMAGKAPVRTREEFEARVQESWGRLAVVTREVVEVVARVLEARAKVAQRLSGGTPRLWAESVADIREQAAYLMPAGFLGNVGWEQLRSYPKYVEAMRERLFSLREGGSGSEKGALQQFGPYWKRFTAWVAAAMGAERAAGEEEERAKMKPGKAPLPQTRRNSPVVNVDAGAWAMTPGNLTPAVARYRWALEEARVVLFVPAMAGAGGATLKELDEAWKRVSAAP